MATGMLGGAGVVAAGVVRAALGVGVLTDDGAGCGAGTTTEWAAGSTRVRVGPGCPPLIATAQPAAAIIAAPARPPPAVTSGRETSRARNTDEWTNEPAPAGIGLPAAPAPADVPTAVEPNVAAVCSPADTRNLWANAAPPSRTGNTMARIDWFRSPISSAAPRQRSQASRCRSTWADSRVDSAPRSQAPRRWMTLWHSARSVCSTCACRKA